MNLFLVQHADAVDKAVDADRPLSEKGVREATVMAGFAAKLGLDVPEIRHSGRTRSRQTADLLLPSMAPRGRAVAREGLEPNDPVKPLARELKSRREDLAIVGHLPHLSRLASVLLAGDEDAETVAFQKAGIVALQRDDEGRWRVRWAVFPEILGLR